MIGADAIRFGFNSPLTASTLTPKEAEKAYLSAAINAFGNEIIQSCKERPVGSQNAECEKLSLREVKDLTHLEKKGGLFSKIAGLFKKLADSFKSCLGIRDEFGNKPGSGGADVLFAPKRAAPPLRAGEPDDSDDDDLLPYRPGND